MSDTVIRVEHLSKKYKLGVINNGTLYKDIQTWLALKRRKEDPNASIDKRYANTDDIFWALKDVSFDIKQGDRVGIIGKNGAGKSTLLKILSRITDPTEGIVKIKGKIASLLEVGTGFHGELTGRENVYINGAILGMKSREITRKLDEIIAFSGVEKYIDTPVKRYSSGMYVRLAFAVAAHLDSDILIADEVLAVGDAEFQKKALGKMQNLSVGQGRTVLFVSHNMVAVKELCDTGVVLEGGEVKLLSDDIQNAIRSYMFLEDVTKNTSWVNADNFYCSPYFSPLEIFIGDYNGNKILSPIDNNTDFYIHIRGTIDILNPSFHIGYALYDENYNLLFWSMTTDEEQKKWPILKTGQNHIYSKIPKRLLNEGYYRLEINAGIYYQKTIYEPMRNSFGINFKIHGGLSNSVFFTHKRPGILAPVIQWQQK
jgi:lipopolysaccharide transport system ATP-binding protein